MKKISLGLILALVLLPQVSFAQNETTSDTNPASVETNTLPVAASPIVATVSPQLAAFNAQQSAAAQAFFAGQAQERGQFMQAHADVMAKHDARFKALLAISMAQRTGKSTSGLATPPDEDPRLAAFISKQQSDKGAFLGKQAQDKQAFLAANPS